jgi:hypothetical protein
MRRLRAFLRNLLARFMPAPIPEGWTEKAMAEIRPRGDEPFTGEIPAVETTGPIIVVDEHLGTLFAADMTPSRAWLFEAVRDLHPVDLTWAPGWLDWAGATA